MSNIWYLVRRSGFYQEFEFLKKAGRYIIYTGSCFHTQTRISPETTHKVEYFQYRTEKKNMNFQIKVNKFNKFFFVFGLCDYYFR